MNINKAHWTTEGDSVKLSMPFAKVDVERRIVSGFATLDNVDKQGDIVSTEASLEAFKKFRGNLREMHQPIAVGKVLYFKEDRYFDPESKKFYKGVYVSTYVSKGAQDTWEKVLDGTYTGFSIGGNITRTEETFDEDTQRVVRVIKAYDLFELSIVDNPANQFATILSVQKMNNGENVVDGYLSKTEINNVFWCKSDDIVHVSEDSDSNCPVCAKGMQNIGFIEKSDAENPEMIKFLVDSAKGISTIKMTKEEVPMTEENTSVESTDVVEEAAVEATEVVEKAEGAEEAAVEDTTATDTPETETETEETAETAETTEEVAEVVEEAVEKSDAALAEAVTEIKDSLTNAFGDLVATVKSISDAVAELQKSLAGVSSDVAGVTSKVADVANEVATVKGSVSEFGKRVDAVEHDTAFRKSGDLGEIVQELPSEKMEKSLWGGRFLKTSDLFN